MYANDVETKRKRKNYWDKKLTTTFTYINIKKGLRKDIDNTAKISYNDIQISIKFNLR